MKIYARSGLVGLSGDSRPVIRERMGKGGGGLMYYGVVWSYSMLNFNTQFKCKWDVKCVGYFSFFSRRSARYASSR